MGRFNSTIQEQACKERCVVSFVNPTATVYQSFFYYLILIFQMYLNQIPDLKYYIHSRIKVKKKYTVDQDQALVKLGFGSLCTFGSLDAKDAPANVVLVLFRWL